mgnify:CR=1 FL=1
MKQTNHNPPELIQSDNPKELFGWPRVCELISQRWPKWEPTTQDLRDWRHLLGPLTFDWLDEALLRVRTKYASDIPKLKWVMDSYYRVRDEQREVSIPNLEQEKVDAELDLKREIINDRKECDRMIGELSEPEFNRLLEEARREFTFLPRDGSTPESVGQVTKYAIKFLLERNAMT